jgi:hypothetical protein
MACDHQPLPYGGHGDCSHHRYRLAGAAVQLQHGVAVLIILKDHGFYRALENLVIHARMCSLLPVYCIIFLLLFYNIFRKLKSPYGKVFEILKEKLAKERGICDNL